MGADAAPFVDIAGALAGGGLGQLAGGSSGSSQSDLPTANNSQGLYYTPGFVNQMNTMLQSGLNTANSDLLNTTVQGQSELTGQQQASQQALTSANSAANSALQTSANNGLSQYMALNQPYAQAGYQAQDALSDSLGLTRPTAGSGAVASALFNQNQAQQAMAGLGAAPTVMATPTAPTNNVGTLQSYLSGLTPDQINTYFQNNLTASEGSESSNQALNQMYYTGVGGVTSAGLDANALNSLQAQIPTDSAKAAASAQAYLAPYTANYEGGGNNGNDALITTPNSTQSAAISNYLAQQQMSQAQAAYQAQQTTYQQQLAQQQQQQQALAGYNTTANNTLSSIGWTPQQAALAASANSGLFTKTGS